jgi:hypothetical protein
MYKVLSVAISLIVFAGGVAYADKMTTLINPKTDDRVTLRTDDNGTYVTHSKGRSGYILTRARGSSEGTTRSDMHEYYVLDYAKGGYVKVEQ